MKENINKLTATLSETTRTLQSATALANDAVEEVGKLQEKISALFREREKLSAEIEELQDEKAQLIGFLQKTKENLHIKRQEILHELEEELFKKIDSLKNAANDGSTLSSDRKPKAFASEGHSNTVKKSTKNLSDTTVLDRFKAQTSINDTISKPKSPTSVKQQPITSIAKTIGINDRFLFIREFFDGDTALFSQAVKKLDAMDNIEDAKKYIRTVIKNWDETAEPAQLFLSIVQRRYL
jgi:5'-deoxynucleotidase YfbR-like HD superfamily hydrolase